MIRNGLQAFAGALGYRVTKQRSTKNTLFNALCEYVFEQSDRKNDIENEFLIHCMQHVESSSSQRFQDVLADFVMRGAPGVFCEFGATDGISLSNSYYLESARNWTGVLAEPGRQWHQRLANNRPNAKIDTRCVFSETGSTLTFNEVREGEYSSIAGFSPGDAHAGRRKNGIKYDVETVSLNDLLSECGITKLEYLSVDTEGSELTILRPFDFTKFRPNLVTVEHNFTAARVEIDSLLRENGYFRILEDFSAFDDWYVDSSQDSPFRR